MTSAPAPVADAASVSDSAIQAQEWHAAWKATVRRAFRLRRVQIGAGILLVIVFIAVLGPMLAPHGPTDFVGIPFESPSLKLPLGTDYLGRDAFSRFLYGGRSILLLALSATILGVVSGIAIGLAAAYSRPSVDEGVMRLMDVLMAFPPIILAILVMATVGPKLWLLVLAVAASHAPRVARLARGSALEVIHRDYVKAAEAAGEPRFRILGSEVLPNITSPLLVDASLRLTYSIALIASLSFLGFGLQPPAADWGLMISENRIGLTVQPWPVIGPIVGIALLTIATSLIADGFSRTMIGIERSIESE